MTQLNNFINLYYEINENILTECGKNTIYACTLYTSNNTVHTVQQTWPSHSPGVKTKMNW